jgi:pimeloyl-ACP methyl ester carboxylesterase
LQKGEGAGIGVWLSYDWPGERAFFGKTLGRSLRTAAELVCYLAVWLLLLAAPLLLLGLALSGLTHSERAFPLALGLAAALAVIAGALLFTVWLLRATSYQRDLYVALHRGVPDLCEFLRHLDYTYYERHKVDRQDGTTQPQEALPPEKRIKLHVIAHSMGSMITLNTVRILSDLFDRAPGQKPDAKLGRSLEVSTLTLAGADVPVELLQVGQNNYFYSALRRFDRMCVFSNAHDAVLHTLGYFANSFAEPQPGRSRSRLGTVFHLHTEAQPPPTAAVCARRWLRDEPVFEVKTGDPVADPALIRERLTFIDCSQSPKLSRGLVRMFAGFPPVRDLLALLLYRWVDCHAGYFDDDRVWEKMHDVIRRTMKPGEQGNEVL